MDKGKFKNYEYRPAYGDFGYSPVKSTRGKLSKEQRKLVEEWLCKQAAKGLIPTDFDVDDWWEQKKAHTRHERNRRRRLARQAKCS